MCFLKRKSIHLTQRDFKPVYLLDENTQRHFEIYGYAIIRNIITEIEIEEAWNKFNEIKKMNGYAVNKSFESSGNFESIELQRYIFNFIQYFMNKTAIRYANLENCEIGKGGAFFIKPNSPESCLEPHQDSPVIDESKTYAIFSWIPLQDITENSGALYVLPKSHLWGNVYRSQHIPWAFRNSCRELWKHMIPLYVNKGDIILFDPSIIHSSGVNNTEHYRLALCGALLPKSHQKVEYTIYRNGIMKHYIDDTYWLDGGSLNSLKKFESEYIDYSYPNPINKQTLKSLLKR